MRRTKMALLGIMMVLSITACAEKAEPKNSGMEPTAQETTTEEKTQETVEAESGENAENMLGMPNPYTDHDSLEEAEEYAGFKIQVPDEICGAKAAAFRNLGTKMLEVIYYDGDTEVARVRKGTGEDDISGDYNEYELDETVDAADTQVTLKGSADGYALAVWNADGYAYAVSVTKETSKDEMLKLVEEIMER